MIEEYLGESFDLHGGGVDLVFPHHENEIAQSQCACGGQFAAHWFHTTHLLVYGGNMSKSIGNLYTLEDLAERGFTAVEVRYALIGAHYRKQLNFTLDSLGAAREALAKMAKSARGLAERAGDRQAGGEGGGLRQCPPGGACGDRGAVAEAFAGPGLAADRARRLRRRPDHPQDRRSGA